MLALVKQRVGGVFTGMLHKPSGNHKGLSHSKLCSALEIVNKQNEYIIHMENQTPALKSDVIVNKGAVIDLQKELITANDSQLKDLKR